MWRATCETMRSVAARQSEGRVAVMAARTCLILVSERVPADHDIECEGCDSSQHLMSHQLADGAQRRAALVRRGRSSAAGGWIRHAHAATAVAAGLHADRLRDHPMAVWTRREVNGLPEPHSCHSGDESAAAAEQTMVIATITQRHASHATHLSASHVSFSLDAPRVIRM